MNKNILIIGTVPYEKGSTSRAFDSYFSGENNRNLAQIFTNPSEPLKGHCSTLYQITDYMLLKRWFRSKYCVGKVYNFEELKDSSMTSIFKKSTFINFLYKLGSLHLPITHLLRKLLWKKKFWMSKEFLNWVDMFKPDVIFLSFSNDFFVFDISKVISSRFNIPVISVLGDDYVFNHKFSLSLFYHLYRKMFIKTVNDFFSKQKKAIFISDKIKKKYENEFKLSGETIYLSSFLSTRPFKKINTENPKIYYFGNVGLDRHISLSNIAKALYEINSKYTLHIYANKVSQKIVRSFKRHSNIVLENKISYSDVLKKIYDSDLILMVEGFTKYNVLNTRYSLSTKVADTLISGSNVFVYGSKECGMIQYLIEEDACMVCSDRDKLKKTLNEFIENVNLQEKYYYKSIETYHRNHSLSLNLSKVEKVIFDTSI